MDVNDECSACTGCTLYMIPALASGQALQRPEKQLHDGLYVYCTVYCTVLYRNV